jgi:small subunit ribosomal protein S17
VAITPGWRTSQHKRHVVKHIIAPGSGIPIEARPPIPTLEERIEAYEAKRKAKVGRREARKTQQQDSKKQERDDAATKEQPNGGQES